MKSPEPFPPSWPTRSASTKLGFASSQPAKVLIGIAFLSKVPGFVPFLPQALTIQQIIERKVRLAMKKEGIKSLPIYPEYRKSFYPTTSKIFYNFDGISSYRILKDGKVIKEFKDSLSSTQKTILGLLDMDENKYWG